MKIKLALIITSLLLFTSFLSVTALTGADNRQTKEHYAGLEKIQLSDSMNKALITNKNNYESYTAIRKYSNLLSSIKTFTRNYQLSCGLSPGFLFPIGDVGSVMKSGFGGNIFADMRIPFSFLEGKGFKLRGGLLIGYTRFSSSITDSSAKINMLPILAYADISYPLQKGIRPFVRLGSGGTIVSLKDKSGAVTDTSSFDYSILIGAGAGYTLKSIPYIEFLFNAGYLIAFEQVNGNFMNVTLGASYHFYTSGEKK